MAADPFFQMTVEDVFFIRGRGTVVTGQVAQGTLKSGDEIQLRRGEKTRKVVVAGIESFHKQMNEAGPGANIGLLLKDLTKDDVQRGDILSGDSGPGGDFSWNF